MQSLTLEQLRATHEAGGITGVTIKAQGGDFLVRFVTRNGDAVLTKARSTEPRYFSNPLQAINLLKGVGIMIGTFDVSLWNPLQKNTSRVRPDRAVALKQVHEAADYDRWFRAQVEQGLQEAEDPATEWVTHELVKEDIAQQRAALLVRASGNN
ncbi:hypothetical protein [Solimicrobium silvestre]|uniref:Prevent host death protein, Phd antitoxin n=1 Tax=Solimicrobium silvestre TaxID=2099400 RepID=A0A2S9H3Q7_9BURK|nr:hypothetical protein [Solimicrobium silvestre]PRC94609.1 hypothetical protein S2091_0612 [Solimicrobium silvestre]